MPRTDRQQQAVEAAITSGSLSPTKVGAALGIHRVAAYGLLTRANASAELARHREDQRDKARGITRAITRLIDAIGHDQLPDDPLHRIAAADKLLDVLKKQQDLGIGADEDRAPAEIRASIARAHRRSLLLGAKMHARGVTIAQLRSRLQRL